MIFAGPDDMPAQIKSSMFGCALMYAYFFDIFNLIRLVERECMANSLSYMFRIPITDGHLNMGTWQVLVCLEIKWL
jgi:thiamine phosphate synthase YjbQ (UPF0047 family)